MGAIEERSFNGLTLAETVGQLLGDAQRVLVVPPDFTRLHSFAGEIVNLIMAAFGDRVAAVLPATGTHRPMTHEEISTMYGAVPPELIRERDWRRSAVRIGELSASEVSECSDGLLDEVVPVEVDRALLDPSIDFILSLSQVVPHEVVGMSGHAKNLLVGAGGPSLVNGSHFLGALVGIEEVLGRIDTPPRALLERAMDRARPFLRNIGYLHVVVGSDPDQPVLRGPVGWYGGEGLEPFHQAARHAQRENITVLEEPVDRAVVYVDPQVYQSTWLANKAIYRTRMAIRDGGELIVVAPGVSHFGEDAQADALIRRLGYRGRDRALEMMSVDPELAGERSVVAHSLHGSSEGRFSVAYATTRLTKEELQGVGFEVAPLRDWSWYFSGDTRPVGVHEIEGVSTLFVDDPGQGLWMSSDRARGIWGAEHG
jgi:nickel-dependent lactate racemase